MLVVVRLVRLVRSVDLVGCVTQITTDSHSLHFVAPDVRERVEAEAAERDAEGGRELRAGGPGRHLVAVHEARHVGARVGVPRAAQDPVRVARK